MTETVEVTAAETESAVAQLVSAELPAFDFGAFAVKAETLNDWNSAVIFGDPGAGKSWMGGSVSALGKTLLLDTEGGAASVSRNWPNVDVIAIDSHEKLEFFVHKLLTEKHDYECVIIDTIGTAQARAEKYFRGLPQNVSKKTGEIDGYAVFAMLKDWLVAPTYVDERDGLKKGGLAWKLHEAPFKAILIAHTKVDRDESGAVSIVPNLLGGAKDVLPAIPDMVLYLTRENVDDEVQRVAYASSGGSITTKNRFDLPAKIYKPTFGQIAELIKAYEPTTEEK